MKHFLILFILLFSLFACSDDSKSPTVGSSDNANFIKGRVVTSEGEGVPATITLYSADSTEIGTIVCDENGEYVFNVNENGNYFVVISYNSQSTSYTVNYTLDSGYTADDIVIIDNNISPPSDTLVLIPTTATSEMTVQFINSTEGEYPDSLLFLTVIGRNADSEWCYITETGEVVVISGSETSEEWFFRLSDIDGFQIPETFTSARLYISVEETLEMNSVLDINGDVGIVQPNLANPNDPNYEKIFEWIEFTVANGQFWGNTTQVDQFSFPVQLSLYKDSDVLVDGVNGELVRKIGVEKTRAEVFSDFEALAPAEFQNLLKTPYRIVAPCKGNFDEGNTNGEYYSEYVDEVWEQYKTDTLTVDHPLGDFKGIVLDDDRFEFTRVSDDEKFYIAAKPNNNEIFEGSGVLASGTTEELALQAWVCAAFNRNVVHYNHTDEWNDEANYYQGYPMNYYSKFFHDVSIDGKAYGYCYDDVNDQATLIYTPDVRAIVIDVKW